MNKRTINRALRPLGLEIQNNRGGYSYFTSRRFGHQIGASVYVSYLSSLPLSRWVDEARAAIREHRATGVPYADNARRMAKHAFKFSPTRNQQP
jgi:hypothetical protein